MSDKELNELRMRSLVLAESCGFGVKKGDDGLYSVFDRDTSHVFVDRLSITEFAAFLVGASFSKGIDPREVV